MRRDTVSFRAGPHIDRECTSKTRYPNEFVAEQEARYIFDQGGPVLRAYKCPWCFGAHLTKRLKRPISIDEVGED